MTVCGSEWAEIVLHDQFDRVCVPGSVPLISAVKVGLKLREALLPAGREMEKTRFCKNLERKTRIKLSALILWIILHIYIHFRDTFSLFLYF